jgi:ATP-dependent Lon protease
MRSTKNIQIINKMSFYQNVIQNTLLHINKTGTGSNLELTDAINSLFKVNDKLKQLSKNKCEPEIVNSLQEINNDLSIVIKKYGTHSLEDLLMICFGTRVIYHPKYELLKTFFHPTSYIIKSETVDTIVCTDVNTKHFNLKLTGIKVANQNMVITGIVDNVMIDFLNNDYILSKQTDVSFHLPEDSIFHTKSFTNFIAGLSLKDYLIYDDCSNIYNKYAGYMSKVKQMSQHMISNIVKEFNTSDLFMKRELLIQLLLDDDNFEHHQLAYLLYDLLSNDVNGNEQEMLFESFHWHIKKQLLKPANYFKNATLLETNKIPLEQQIYLLKTTDLVKEKACAKLKEIKNKQDDNGSKARQYLEGLLKIPFSIYKREPILCLMDSIRAKFKVMCLSKKNVANVANAANVANVTNLEIMKYIQLNKSQLETIDTFDKPKLIQLIMKMNLIADVKIPHSGKGKTKSVLKQCIIDEMCKHPTLYEDFLPVFSRPTEIEMIQKDLTTIQSYINNITPTLNASVYGHTNAKKQIERIIGQWINGSMSGYCFGFEGAPGIGKTSLAKNGLSNCLKDEHGISRPFAMLQMGGDSNGSTLHGHNYTYVGSSWGSIVQILIDKQCMNPIIFIDEVDKISKTEHGREIVGILTHLLDSTQNDCFQDKYFSGIDLDLSKALFILSYNDPELIDRVLLDRIHRIKFNNLSLEDKIIVSDKHLLPEIYTKMGLENMIAFDAGVVKFIIEEYTCEAGVRKLKEILFEIVSEINLEILKNNCVVNFPILVTKDDITGNYLKDHVTVTSYKIHDETRIGIINGLWANSAGMGGVLPIEIQAFPTCLGGSDDDSGDGVGGGDGGGGGGKFLELKLTGSLGDIMKESIQVALTMAWNLTDKNTQHVLSNKYNKYGLHIHCGDCSTPKDGPSALSTICVLIYSLFNERKVKHYFGITGEMDMGGTIRKIGGLDLKILGGIKAGIKEFIFPFENQGCFDKFMEKNREKEVIRNIRFHPVKHIKEVFELILT